MYSSHGAANQPVGPRDTLTMHVILNQLVHSIVASEKKNSKTLPPLKSLTQIVNFSKFSLYQLSE